MRGPEVDALKDEFPRSRNIQQRQIFRGRTDENQIVVLGVVQREQCSALHSQLPIEENEDAVKLMDRQHFSHARVMIEDQGSRVGRRVEVAHAGLRPSHKAAIAEDYPGRLRAGDEAVPENLVSGGADSFAPACVRIRLDQQHAHWSISAATNNTESTTTAIAQPRFEACAVLLRSSSRAHGRNRSQPGRPDVRTWKVSVYDPLGNSTKTGSSGPSWA